MDFNDILRKNDIDPKSVLVLRHSPSEKELRKVFLWLAGEHPELFNAYQANQYPRAEAAMAKAKHIASCIGHAPGKALFVGLYQQAGSNIVKDAVHRSTDAMRKLSALGMNSDPAKFRSEYQVFDLRRMDTLSKWKGRLIIDWPKPEVGWFKWAANSAFNVHAITEDSLLVKDVPHWTEISMTCETLPFCPAKWQAELKRCRGIYYIFDEERRMGYVGSAYGEENIWQRWTTHTKTGGDAKKLKQCNARNFVFTILERTSPDMGTSDIVALEGNWKARLHTVEHGLNDN